MGQQSDALQARIHRFALGVLALIRHLPTSEPGPTIRRQLAQSALAMDMNYRATCRARSHREFTARIAVVAEEADETLGWLTTIADAELLVTPALAESTSEARELRAIVAASAATARRRERQTSAKRPGR